jgi:hypothetical protein
MLLQEEFQIQINLSKPSTKDEARMKLGHNHTRQLEFLGLESCISSLNV